MRQAIVITFAACVSLCVKSAFPYEYSTADYSRVGAELFLDAIDNDGVGEHNPTATVWKDLAGRHDFTLRTPGSWKDGNSFYVNKGCAAASAVNIPDSFLTAEIVYVSTTASGKSGWILYTGAYKNRSLYDYNGGSLLQYSTMAKKDSEVTSQTCGGRNATNHCAAVYETVGAHVLEDVYFGGESTEGCPLEAEGNVAEKSAYLGSRNTNSSDTQVRIFAIRLYNRKLTAAEIRWHYALDRARFFSDSALADELRPKFRIPEIPPQEILGGTYARPQPEITDETTGETLVPDVDYECSYRDNAAPGTAMLIVTGKGDYAGQRREVSFEIVRVRADEYVAESYIRKGLIAQLDGIDNVGAGAHDASAAIWKDLVGGLDFTLKTGGSWGEKFFGFNGLSAEAAKESWARLPLCRTIEAVFTFDKLTSGFLLYTPNMNREIILRESGVLWLQSVKDVSARIPLGSFSDIHQIAAVYGETLLNAAYRDAEAVEQTQITEDVYGKYGDAPRIGLRNTSSNSTKGRIYALRFYERELTAEEIAWNWAVDRARFFDDYSPFCDFKIDPIGTQLYDGVNPVTPEPIVRTKEGVVLTKGFDYDLTYENNKSSGVGKVCVVGKGAYSGMKLPASFTIVEPIYVAAAACGAGDGSNWANAATLMTACGAMTNGSVAVVKAETIALAEGVVIDVPCTILGGYSGNSSAPFEKVAGAKTVISGGGATLALVTVSTDASKDEINEFHDLVFTEAKQHGFVKSGAAGLLMVDCDFVENGLADTSYVGGRGALLSGTSESVATLRNCSFHYNMATNGVSYYGNGVGLNVEKFLEVRLENCSFVGNGIAPWLRGAGVERALFGAALYATAPVSAKNCEFRLNHAGESGSKCGGSVCLAGGTGHSFVNCAFVANAGTFMNSAATTGGGVVRVALADSAKSAAFERCTFAYNLSDSTSCANLNVISGRATVRNCIFADAVVSGRYVGGKYVHVYSGAKCDVSDSLFSPGGTASAMSAERGIDLSVGKNMTYGDPAFMTTPEEVVALTITEGDGTLYFDPAKTNELTAINVHLRNSDGVYSAAIDQGAEEDSVGDEPMPNANRLNLGAYGGTAEAATSSPDAATLTDFAVSWPDGVSIPKCTATVGGDEGALYNADLEIFCATGSQIVAGEWVKLGRAYGLHNGDSVDLLSKMPLVPGDAYTMRVVVNNGSEQIVRDVSGMVGGVLPAWFEKGGGTNVIHVWSESVYEETGADWAHAYRTVAAALAAWTAEKDEIWISGTNGVNKNLATFSPTVAVAIRGGFTATENSAAERPAETYAQLDGQDEATTIFSLENTAVPVTFERIEFYRGKQRGLSKNGSGDIILDSCRFIDNSIHDCNHTGGYGAWIVGGSTARALVTNCWFEGQYFDDSSGGSQNNGRALYVQRCKSVDILGTTFLRNGSGFFGRTGANSPNRNSCGTTLCIEDTQATLRHSVFRANRGTVGGEYNPDWGGVVSIGGACGGSLVENCLFVGNADTFGGTGGGQPTRSGSGGGALVFRLTDAMTSAAVKNCTFAYNLSDAIASAAALTVQMGDVDVMNCLFARNQTGEFSVAAKDIAFADGAKGSVSYSLFDGELEASISSSNTVPVIAMETLCFGDARLVSTNRMEDLVLISGGLTGFAQTQSTLDALLALNCHVRGRAGYVDEQTKEICKFSGVNSPAIDAGNPSSDYRNESSPNGKRVNLGFYGNTPWATMSPGGLLILVK